MCRREILSNLPPVKPYLLLLALALSARGQTLHFGTNLVSTGQVVEFSAPLNAKAAAEVLRAGRSAQFVKGAFFLPPGYTNLSRPCPLLVFSVPSGGAATKWMSSMTNVALSEGWALFAADGPKVEANDDTIQFGWAILSSALDQFNRTWPMTKQWPVACAGFSGGAKRSAAVAAAMMKENWRVIGVFMGGCNEDRATLGQQLFDPPAQFKRVPMFLSNGDRDPIANPHQGTIVQDSMTRSGFTTISLETYSGEHQLNQDQLREALQWFKQSAGLNRPRR